MKRIRIDKLLFEKGLADSRNKAQAMVMAGVVLVNEKRVDKSSESFFEADKIRIKGESPESKYVGRGGLKLEKALSTFHITPDKYICLDVGSSTGGFTDCLLQNGAERVYAIDVGTNQLVWKLRTDSRVIVRENTNARTLLPTDFPERFDLIVMDVSFISVRKIIPRLIPLLAENGRILILIKPQFEVGRADVEKGGVVKDQAAQARVVEEIKEFSARFGLKQEELIDSPILGAAGNREFLALYGKG